MALLFLCGQKCCGKSYYLNHLKENFFIAGYDLDEELCEIHGLTSVRQLYKSLGEEEFRKAEKHALECLLEKIGRDNAVIAIGGGATALLDKCNETGKTVYLYQNKDILWNRMNKIGLPDFITSKTQFYQLFDQRDKAYREKCSKRLDLEKSEEKIICQTLLEMYLS